MPSGNPSGKSTLCVGLLIVKHIVYQLERGDQGTPHLQGYIQLSRTQRMSWLKKVTSKTADGEVFNVFDRAHLIVAKGNADQNKAYCTKAEGRLEGPWTIGEAPKQGDRTDLKEAAEQLMRTGDIRAIDPGVFLKYASGCLKLAALAPPPRRDNLKVITIVGPTGIGKSYAVHDLFPDIYVVNMGNSGLWWDGYTGQQAVMFEEFKGQVQLQKMLQILDPYPLRLEIKGGLVPARFTTVFITSNYTPDKWYKNDDGARDEEMKALARRIDIGDPSRIPPRPDGPRYIHVDTREALHQRLQIMITAGIISPPPKAAVQIAPVSNSQVAPADPVAAVPLPQPSPSLDCDDDNLLIPPPALRRALEDPCDDVLTFSQDLDEIRSYHPDIFAPQP